MERINMLYGKDWVTIIPWVFGWHKNRFWLFIRPIKCYWEFNLKHVYFHYSGKKWWRKEWTPERIKELQRKLDVR